MKILLAKGFVIRQTNPQRAEGVIKENIGGQTGKGNENQSRKKKGDSRSV